MRLTRRSFLAVTGLAIIGHGTAISHQPAHKSHKSHQALAGLATGTGAARMASLTINMGTTQYPGVPAFVTTTINVDGTNTTDEVANISNTIAAAASGSASVWRRFILQPSGGTTVRVSAAVQISIKSYFILDLNGCTLKTDTAAAFTQQTSGIEIGHTYGGFFDGQVDHFIITNGGLWQNNPNPGVYLAAREGQANIEIAGGATSPHDGKVYNMTLKGAGGDNVIIGGSGSNVYNIDGWNNTCVDAGRNGISVIYGHDINWGVLGANSHGACGYVCIDIEPNIAANPCSNIDVANNTWTTWAQEFAALNGSSTASAFDNIKIRNNTISGSSLKTVFTNTASRPTNISFTGNTSTAAAVAGPVLSFVDIDGLTVTGNTQPLSSGVLVSATSCTNAVTSPNP